MCTDRRRREMGQIQMANGDTNGCLVTVGMIYCSESGEKFWLGILFALIASVILCRLVLASN